MRRLVIVKLSTVDVLPSQCREHHLTNPDAIVLENLDGLTPLGVPSISRNPLTSQTSCELETA